VSSSASRPGGRSARARAAVFEATAGLLSEPDWSRALIIAGNGTGEPARGEPAVDILSQRERQQVPSVMTSGVSESVAIKDNKIMLNNGHGTYSA
jgi:hypothetical protein